MKSKKQTKKRLLTLKEVKKRVGDKRYKEMEDTYEAMKRQIMPNER